MIRSFVRSRTLAVVAICAAAAAAPFATPLISSGQGAGGATPASGSVGPANGSSTEWDFDPIAGAGSGGTPLEVQCVPGQCSKYTLTVKLPAADSDFYQHWTATLTYRCSWNEPVQTDVDCFTFSPGGAETGPGKPDQTNTASFEEINIVNPQSGDWSLRADEAAGATPSPVHGVAKLTFTPTVTAPGQNRLPTDQRFVNYDFYDIDPNYESRDALQRPNAGEPSLGVDWATGEVMYMAGSQVTKITYNNATPPKPTLTDVTPLNSQVNEDAILFTDRQTHRTWAIGLLLAGSHEAYSDDDGATWTLGAAFSPPAMPDHETLGAGPYHDPAPSHSYVHAVYYCAQTIVQDAYCGRSDDGGMTWSTTAKALWNGACSPIHGHVRVGPTGVVYVPNQACTDAKGVGRQGVAVSVDNGNTFTVSMIPDSSPGGSDPSVMEGPDGTVYFGYQASNGHPTVAAGKVNPDGTIKWANSIDVGHFADAGETEDNLALGVQNTEFSEIVTGDPGRAAFAFLGAGLPGDDQAGDYQGVWYLFVSYTFDGGRTWRTVNATPGQPVQRGCVWNGGLVNACRNMLDFNDIGIDKQGRVYVAYTDGCTNTPTYDCDHTKGIHGWNNLQTGDTTGGCQPSEEMPPMISTSTCTFARMSAVARQVCGRGLIAAADPGFNESPDCATTASVPVTNAAVTSKVAGITATPNTSVGGIPAWPGVAVVVAMLGGGAVLRRRRRAA